MQFDCVVIGSGVAGALIAKSLAAFGKKVCVLEAGGEIERSSAVQAYQQATDRNLTAPYPTWPKVDYPRDEDMAAYYGKAKNPDTEYYPSFIKGLGGTTWHWTAMTPRMLPADFRLQSRYRQGMDWPIDYQELEPWYVKAEKALGISGNSEHDHGSPRSKPYPMSAIPLPYSDQLIAKALKKQGIMVDAMPAARNSQEYRGRPACCGYGTCTPICPIGATYSANTDIQEAIRSGATVTTDAMVYQFELSETGHIRRALFKRPDGSIRSVSADYFVLACNSIETPRLMLMAAGERCPDGLGNRSGQVGRHLMDHVLMQCRFQMPQPLYMGRGPQSVSVILKGRDGEFRKEHAAAKLFIGNDRNVAREAFTLLEDVSNHPHIMDRIRERLIHQGMIGAEIEQLPMAGNRLRLDAHRVDRHGLPLPSIDFALSEYTQKGVAHWGSYLESMVKKMGGHELQLKQSLTSHHPCGTTRMGFSHKDSVVNRDCRSHDHPNLFIAGSSVFPTIGTANPTLTIAALALRLADYLKQQS